MAPPSDATKTLDCMIRSILRMLAMGNQSSAMEPLFQPFHLLKVNDFEAPNFDPRWVILSDR